MSPPGGGKVPSGGRQADARVGGRILDVIPGLRLLRPTWSTTPAGLLIKLTPPYPQAGPFPPPVSGCARGPTVHGWFPVLGLIMAVGVLPWFHFPLWGRWWL